MSLDLGVCGQDPVNRMRTIAATIANLLGQMMPESSHFLFWLWVRGNAGNLQAAAAELGVHVAPGGKFMSRLEKAITPKLEQLDREGRFPY